MGRRRTRDEQDAAAAAAVEKAVRAAAVERAQVERRAEKILRKTKPKYRVGIGTVPRRVMAMAVQAHAELTAKVVVEQMARGALFDPRAYFYREAGQELYETDGPMQEDALGNKEPAWRAGDIKREWGVGDAKPLHELTEAEAQGISAVEVVMKNATAGDGRIDRVLKYKFAPREKYVELAARHFGMLLDRTETNVNVTVVGSKLDEARQTWAKLRDIEMKVLPEPEGEPQT